MPSVIIRIELHEISTQSKPTSDTYTTLHNYMIAQGWWKTISGDQGNVVDLPSAMYQGMTTLDVASFSDALIAEVKSKVWRKATVFVIQWNAWSIRNSS